MEWCNKLLFVYWTSCKVFQASCVKKKADLNYMRDDVNNP